LERLNLHYDEPLSNIGFNFNWHHYNEAAAKAAAKAGGAQVM
jgi:hypothetical protein